MTPLLDLAVSAFLLLTKLDPCTWSFMRAGPPPSSEGGKETQGLNCAAFSYERDGKVFVEGYYGSRVDMTIFEWTGGAAGKQPICDGCILENVLSGTMVAVGRGEP